MPKFNYFHEIYGLHALRIDLSTGSALFVFLKLDLYDKNNLQIN